MGSYFKRRWDESRGDARGGWGSSWWFFEVDADGYATRQIEIYDSGPTKRYSLESPEDADGFLSVDRVDELGDWSTWQIGADEFNRAWAG